MPENMQINIGLEETNNKVFHAGKYANKTSAMRKQITKTSQAGKI